MTIYGGTMGYLAIPMLIFVVIEWSAYMQGLTHLATLALAGSFLCLGMMAGSKARERAGRKGGKDA